MGIKCSKCQSDNPETQRFCSECGTQLFLADKISPSVTKTLETPTRRLALGSLFAERYEILEEIGKGGMGEVYRVRDKTLDEEMALKLLKPEIAADKGIIERFKNELKLARKITHRNVCRMHDLNEEEETPFITMEYVEGKDLKSHIRKKEKLTQEEAISIAKQVCEGLVEAHRLGVIHRDLKPQNIMIDKEGDAKIMDFGIARSVEAPGVTATGMIIGTPDYISPEQAEGEEADQRSDIYSLGAILYEMVTGRVPFKGDTALSVALKHKAQLPQDPRKLNPEVSEDLSRLILVCMEKDKDRRYQTAPDLLTDLGNIDEGFPLGTKIQPRRETFVAALIRKKLFIPALVVALAVIGVLLWQAVFRKDVLTPSQRSVAVLPFIDLSPKKDHEWVSDGISEAMINALSRLEGLRVPARTSSFFFKGKELDIQEVGQKLKVENVLEGSVQVAGDKLRVNAQLISVKDGFQLWSDKFDRRMKDVFSIQDEIARELVRALKVKLLGGEGTQLAKKYTENLEAYNLYLKGRYFWNERTEEGNERAIEHFQRAIDIDPTYAIAYVGLADAYLFLEEPSRKEADRRARAAAMKALEIDYTLAEAHTTLAFMSIFEWEWVAAEKGFQRAVEFNPSYATAHHWYGLLLSWKGEHKEAIAEMKRAHELDPLSLIIGSDLGATFHFARQYDRAIEKYRDTLKADEDFFPAHSGLAGAYLQKGMFEEAIRESQWLADRSPNLRTLAWLGHAYAAAGKRAEAREILSQLIEADELSRRQHNVSYRLARIYSSLGEKENAFQCLEKAYEERSSLLVYLKVDASLDPLRSDPRFQDLLRRINLPEIE